MTSSTIYGSSIGGLSGSLTLAAENARFGTLPVVRQFFGGMPGAVPSGLTTSQMWIVSFKCNATDFTGMAAGTYDSALITTFRSWPAGQPILACYYHEPDQAARFPLANWIPAANHFNNLVHNMTGLVANIQTIQIFTGGLAWGWNGRTLSQYWPTTHPPDHLGLDMDGLSPGSGSYADLTVGVNAGSAFAASKGVPWSVTEFGSSPSTADSSHAGRAAWNTTWANKFSAAGAQYVTYWDDSDVYLSQTNEINAWKALVGQAPATTPAAPTGITCTPATNGLTAVAGWASLPSGVDHLDAYIQGPGQTYPHKLNTSGPIPVTPRTFSFATVPGTTYDPGVTFVASADSAGTIRSGFSSYVVVVAPNPGSTVNAPVITSAVPTQDGTDTELFHLTATATSPVGAGLSYLWTFIYPADMTVSPVTLPAASGDVTLPSIGSWNYTLAVSDTNGLITLKSGSVSTVPVTTSAYTPFVNARMLQHGEDVRNMAIIEQQSKPLTDNAITLLYLRKSAHNAKYGISGSSFNPDDIDPTATVQISAGTIYWGAFILEDIQLTTLLFASSGTVQTGTGVLVSVHDTNGAMLPEFAGAGVNADSVFQGAAGNLVLPLGLQVKRQNWGDLLFWQKFVPASGVTDAALRVGTSPASIGAIGLVSLFSTKTASGLQDPLPLGTGTASKQIWVGAR